MIVVDLRAARSDAGCIMTQEEERTLADQARSSAQLSRVALMVAAISVALSILGMFLPIQTG